MAGINLVKRLKERKAGGGTSPAAASQGPRKIFGVEVGGGGGGALDNVSSGDKIRLVLFIVSVASIHFMREAVRDHTAQREAVMRSDIAQIDTQITAERRKMDALKGLSQEADAFDAQMQELRRKIAIVESLGKNKNLIVRMVDFIVSEMPNNVWLNKMTVTTSTNPKVELVGNATTLQLVSEFMRQLEGAVFFPRWQLVETSKDDKTAGASSKTDDGPADRRNFQMNAQVVPL